MKNTKAQINLKMLFLIGVIIVLLVVGLGGTASIFQPKYDYSFASISGTTERGVDLEVGYKLSDPIYETNAIGCGCECSYDYTIAWKPRKQSESPDLPEGVVEGEWFEGQVTQKPSLTMIWNYASDKERHTQALTKNEKVYVMVKGDTVTQRYTGTIYNSTSEKGCGHIYGSLNGAGTVTIPDENYVEPEEIITETEIKQEQKETVISYSQGDSGVSFLDKIKNFFNKIKEWFRN